VETGSGALPAFFSGLLPEGHRLTVLKNAVKTSLGDELSLPLAVGADVPGRSERLHADHSACPGQPPLPA
jgi:serine/threonine-protein kinase HipA